MVQPCLKQGVLPFEVVAGLCQLPLRSNQVGLRRTQRVALILEFQSRHDLSGFDAIAELAVVFEHTA